MSELDRPEEMFYDDVGVACGTVNKDGKEIEVIGILFPLPTSHIDDVYDERYMNLATAKNLIQNLKDAIQHAEEHMG